VAGWVGLDVRRDRAGRHVPDPARRPGADGSAAPSLTVRPFYRTST
jgi:hypothetical protein